MTNAVLTTHHDPVILYDIINHGQHWIRYWIIACSVPMSTLQQQLTYYHMNTWDQINGLVLERCNSTALAMGLHLSCTYPSKCKQNFYQNSNIFPDEKWFVNAIHKMVASLTRLKWVKGSLTHWGGATHICIGKLTTIGSDNGLSPGWRQAIIWTIAAILLIGPLGTNFSEILIRIQTFSFKKMYSKMSSVKWRPSCPSLNVLSP